MSVLGRVLLDKRSINYSNTIKEVKSILEHFNYEVNTSVSKTATTIGVYDEITEESMQIVICKKTDNFTDMFKHISPNLDKAFYFDYISDNTDMILKFLYYYLKKHPDGFFYIDGPQYFTKDDIDRIYNSDNWDDWC